MFLRRIISAVHKLVSVFYSVPKIWFGVDGNADAKRRKILHVHNLPKKLEATERTWIIFISTHPISTPGEDSEGSVL